MRRYHELGGGTIAWTQTSLKAAQLPNTRTGVVAGFEKNESALFVLVATGARLINNRQNETSNK